MAHVEVASLLNFHAQGRKIEIDVLPRRNHAIPHKGVVLEIKPQGKNIHRSLLECTVVGIVVQFQKCAQIPPSPPRPFFGAQNCITTRIVKNRVRLSNKAHSGQIPLCGKRMCRAGVHRVGVVACKKTSRQTPTTACVWAACICNGIIQRTAYHHCYGQFVHRPPERIGGESGIVPP